MNGGPEGGGGLLPAAILGTCGAFRDRPRTNGWALIALLVLDVLLHLERALNPSWSRQKLRGRYAED